MMEFTTPPSYANTVVNVGAITTVSGTSAEILMAGATNTATHTATTLDEDVDWPEPTAVKYEWNGKTADGKAVTAVLEGELGVRLDRVDVMGELPGFVKALASQASGTRPYIYQYAAKLPLVVKVEGEEERKEEGLLFAEATFIS
jgi:Svf1-like C-terminal lipocalin-like domain